MYAISDRDRLVLGRKDRIGDDPVFCSAIDFEVFEVAAIKTQAQIFRHRALPCKVPPDLKFRLLVILQ
ncbi:hypothetical protein SDC9_165999 [bioreactor metagenome]|uniref:Uncharacterized protein n=1 Tax=bioreactor metagenome TaxID=1076179 RepID=A0A645FVU4_9ZZZZ